MLTDRRINQETNVGRITYSVLSSSSSTWSCSSSGFIFPELRRYPKIVGCCDGIFCIYEKVVVGNPTIYSRITLWNPTTGETKVLPEPEVPHPSCLYEWQIEVGFGFDPQTNDYKVVAGFSSTISCIYSLRNNSWRRLESWICKPNERYLVNVTQFHSSRMDKVYWVSRPRDEWKFTLTNDFYIGYFDVSKEVGSTEIKCLSYPGPYYLIVAGTFTMVKESLIVITYGEELPDLPPSNRIRRDDSWSDEEDNIYYNKSGEYTVYTIWGMLGSEQLNFGSCKWTKLFTVNMQYPFKAISGVWVHGRCFVVDTEQRLHINDSVSSESTNLFNIIGQCSSACQVTSFLFGTWMFLFIY
ncbi:hypothetical protein LINGRAHAP2_LOCUS24929 [Linum grandiflorum]